MTGCAKSAPFRYVMALIFMATTALGLGIHGASALNCDNISYENNSYSLCEFDPQTDPIRLHLNDVAGKPYGQFSKLDQSLNTQGRKLVFAMNGGMYHPDRKPVGYYVEDSSEKMRVISNASPGNFGLLPNGIFCIQEHSAKVIETRAFLANRPNCLYATQSGPMLVIDGALHPRFLPDSTSRYIRNGVGTSADGTRLIFVISNTQVTFYEFAMLFRDKLGMPNALFLDGNVSRLYAPELGRNDFGRNMGPIIAVTEDATSKD